MKQYIMALDQGTTSSRSILFDENGSICAMAQKEFTQIYPKPGWVEHDPMKYGIHRKKWLVRCCRTQASVLSRSWLLELQIREKQPLYGIKVRECRFIMPLCGSAGGPHP